MAKLIFGAFPDRGEADKAIMELEQAGVPRDDFSAIGQSEAVAKNPVADLPKDVTTSGVAVGGTVGGLAGLITGAAAVTGMFVAGPVAVLAGLGWVALTTVAGGAVGAVAGGLVGALVSLGIPEETAERQQAIVQTGGVLIGVEDNKVSEEEVRKCFEQHGAEQIVVIEHAKLPARMASILS